MSSQDYRDSEKYKKGVEVYASKYEAHRLKRLDALYEFSPELAVLSSLITSCTVHSEIKAHAQCLLNVGVTREKIKELLVLLTLYIGVPKIIVAKQLIE